MVEDLLDPSPVHSTALKVFGVYLCCILFRLLTVHLTAVLVRFVADYVYVCFPYILITDLIYPRLQDVKSRNTC